MRPIVPLLWFFVFWGVLLWYFGPIVVADWLDSFAIATCLVLIIRYWRVGWKGLTKQHYSLALWWIAGSFVVATAVLGLRVLREFGLELGIINSTVAGYLFSLLTIIMVYGFSLMVVAIPQQSGRNLNPWAILALTFILGWFFVGVLYVLRGAI